MTDNSQASNFNNLQERNQQVLNDVGQLQATEKKLYGELESVSLTAEEKQQIIDKINEISQIRINLYKNLQDMASYYQKNVSASTTTLGQQVLAIDVMENELNESKRRLNLLQEKKINTLRMAEINTYYSKNYAAHKKLLKTVVVVCVFLIFFALLSNAGILPSNIYGVLVSIVLIIGVIVLGYQLIDMSNRSNMNWDEYNWRFNPTDAPADSSTSTSGETTSSDPWAQSTVACVGSECCYDGSTYDAEQNVCIPTSLYNKQANVTASSSNDSTETFVNASLSRYYSNSGGGVRLPNTKPQPSISASSMLSSFNKYVSI